MIDTNGNTYPLNEQFDTQDTTYNNQTVQVSENADNANITVGEGYNDQPQTTAVGYAQPNYVGNDNNQYNQQYQSAENTLQNDQLGQTTEEEFDVNGSPTDTQIANRPRTTTTQNYITDDNTIGLNSLATEPPAVESTPTFDASAFAATTSTQAVQPRPTLGGDGLALTTENSNAQDPESLGADAGRIANGEGIKTIITGLPPKVVTNYLSPVVFNEGITNTTYTTSPLPMTESSQFEQDNNNNNTQLDTNDADILTDKNGTICRVNNKIVCPVHNTDAEFPLLYILHSISKSGFGGLLINDQVAISSTFSPTEDGRYDIFVYDARNDSKKPFTIDNQHKTNDVISVICNQIGIQNPFDAPDNQINGDQQNMYAGSGQEGYTIDAQAYQPELQTQTNTTQNYITGNNTIDLNSSTTEPPAVESTPTFDTSGFAATTSTQAVQSVPQFDMNALTTSAPAFEDNNNIQQIAQQGQVEHKPLTIVQQSHNRFTVNDEDPNNKESTDNETKISQLLGNSDYNYISINRNIIICRENNQISLYYWDGKSTQAEYKGPVTPTNTPYTIYQNFKARFPSLQCFDPSVSTQTINYNGQQNSQNANIPSFEGILPNQGVNIKLITLNQEPEFFFTRNLTNDAHKIAGIIAQNAYDNTALPYAIQLKKVEGKDNTICLVKDGADKEKQFVISAGQLTDIDIAYVNMVCKEASKVLSTEYNISCVSDQQYHDQNELMTRPNFCSLVAATLSSPRDIPSQYTNNGYNIFYSAKIEDVINRIEENCTPLIYECLKVAKQKGGTHIMMWLPDGKKMHIDVFNPLDQTLTDLYDIKDPNTNQLRALVKQQPIQPQFQSPTPVDSTNQSIQYKSYNDPFGGGNSQSIRMQGQPETTYGIIQNDDTEQNVDLPSAGQPHMVKKGREEAPVVAANPLIAKKIPVHYQQPQVEDVKAPEIVMPVAEVDSVSIKHNEKPITKLRGKWVEKKKKKASKPETPVVAKTQPAVAAAPVAPVAPATAPANGNTYLNVKTEDINANQGAKPEPVQKENQRPNVIIVDNQTPRIDKPSVPPTGAAPAPEPVQPRPEPPTNVYIQPDKNTDITDNITVDLHYDKLLDNIKQLLSNQGTHDVKQVIDIIDHIKLDQQVPREYIQLFDNLSLQLHELGNKVQGDIQFSYDDEPILKEIAAIREQIGNIKIPEYKGDNINVELGDLGDVNEKLKLIEEKLGELKKPTENSVNDQISVQLDGYNEFAKLINELREDVRNLKDKNADVVVASPDVQEITDKLTILLEEKLKDIKVSDNISVEQPNIVVEAPDTQEITDKLNVLLEEKLKDIKVSDNVSVEPNIVVEQQDLSGILGAIDEMKKMMVNVEKNIMSKVEQQLKEREPSDIKIELPGQSVNTQDVTTVDMPAAPSVNTQDIIEVQQPDIKIELPEQSVNTQDVTTVDMPAAPSVNTQDIIEVQQPDIKIELPAEETPKDYINQVLQSILLQNQQGKNNDLMLNLIQELRTEIKNMQEPFVIQLPDEPKVDVTDKIEMSQKEQEKEQPIIIQLPDEPKVDVTDKIEMSQKEQEKEQPIIIQLPDEPKVDVTDKIEINKKEVKKEEPEEIIENVYEEVEKPAKKEETETVITNEYQEKQEPAVQMPAAPTPMPGFMPPHMMPMMMPPVFMPPPPMPMPVPAQQPQQPIVITQNQSDDEEGHGFWSTFFKIFLILLLLASIIGLGLLLWRNTHKTTEQGPQPEPDKKPPVQQQEPDKKPDPEPLPPKKEEVDVNPDEHVNPGPIHTPEGEVVKPVCDDGQSLQINVDANNVDLGTDVGNMTQAAKDAINIENVGVRNQLIGENGQTIDTSRMIINDGKIEAVKWGDIGKDPTIYSGTIQNGKAIINGQTYTIADKNGQAYSSDAIDIASQTSYNRNDNGSLSTDFGTLKQDLQINKNNTFTLNTNTENGTTIASNTVNDISKNSTIQNMLKDKLNDSSLTQGEYNRIMDALDNGKLDDSYFQTINNNKTGYSLGSGTNVGNGAGY